MGRTIAKHFFHPFEATSKEKKEKINLQNWKDEHLPFYYDNIPIYLNKTYRGIDIELENQCKSIIPKNQCLPIISISDKYLEYVKEHIRKSQLYESVNYNIKYQDELPELLDLLKSHKYFMYYMHIPKEKDGIWFCEGRFFSYNEIINTKDHGIFKNIDKFVKDRNISYMSFLEEWAGLIFHLIAEYLIFMEKVKVIFFSCEKCYRPALFIKEELTNVNDTNKIWGTVNIVDTIIYNCTNALNFTDICKERKRSKNNIIYYDERFNEKPESIYKDCEILKNETDGAFILLTEEQLWQSIIEDIKEKNLQQNTNFKFDLIVAGKSAEKILTLIDKLGGNDIIDRVCIYCFNLNKYTPLLNKYDKIKGVYKKIKEVINFIQEKNQESQIYPTIKLLTYNDYNEKYRPLHKKISSQYGKSSADCFKVAISYLKDYLLWYPKLRIKSEKNIDDSRIDEEEGKKVDINSMLEVLQKFKGINDNEEKLIRLYTKERGSFYQDFNYWLNVLDPLAIDKTSWFIAAVIHSLNNLKGKGLSQEMNLYRGIRIKLCDLLNYVKSKNHLICFPSFTSTSAIKEVAIHFSKQESLTKGNSKIMDYGVIFTIKYKFKKGFKPTAYDVSEFSAYPKEKEYLFVPYTFFMVKDVIINHTEKKADIEMEAIGRKEIFEENYEDGSILVYNEMEKSMEKILG